MTIKQAGFSLVEVMLAFLLIAMASMGLMKLQLNLQQKAAFTLQQTQALHIAEQQMERYISRTSNASAALGVIAFSELEDPTHCGSNINGLSAGFYTLDCQIDEITGVFDDVAYKVVVEVSWPKRVYDPHEPTAQYAISLSSYVSIYDEFNM